MISFPKRLQGTDGIRGRVTLNSIADGLDPVEFYLKEGLLTPEFFELYTYCYALLLLKERAALIGDGVVIGWDPRDQSGEFNRAAINGILKAGLNVLVAGMLPTPAMPLFMLKKEAVGAVVLTASHNPSDQNGIKLFHGFSGLKFLPYEDQQLTEKILFLRKEPLDQKPPQGDRLDFKEEARDYFIKLSLDDENSWIQGEGFLDTILIIDASKGAVAAVAETIFRKDLFKKVVLLNLEGNINESCGVADIEGREVIKREDVLKMGSVFESYEALRRIFQEADNDPGVGSGNIKLICLIFDGDGDRCFRLDYQPFQKHIIVSSGDKLGIHQARFLRQGAFFKNDRSLFVNTVESDLNTAISAQLEGYQPLLTGVGDKWILLRAVRESFYASLDLNKTRDKVLFERLKELERDQDQSGFVLTGLLKEHLNSRQFKINKGETRFLIGFEESGHCITAGFDPDKGGALALYAGNGIKTGLNSLVAVKQLSQHMPIKVYFENLRSPFECGIKKTAYVYYVNKSQLESKSLFRKELLALIESELQKDFIRPFRFEQVEFTEESSLVYYSILKENVIQGAVFIRNSGTEDKSALYLRGKKELLGKLGRLHETLILFLMRRLKDQNNPLAVLEKSILKAVNDHDSLEKLKEKNPYLPFDRILKEMELKQQLVCRENSQLILSNWGMELLKTNVT
ncbi:MAG: hypothetical protein OEY59_00090 [Deltaproteobacteria bacterium]|nr:hypothetical protein [Deltaproteobacteria bacterium]